MKTKITLSVLFCITAGILPAQNDCASALLVCDSTIATPSGIGTQELNPGNQGCLTLEHNSAWYKINVISSGNFRMTIDPAGFTDFDWAVWGPNPACPPTAAPMRCSYAIGGGNNTGINSVNNAPQTDTSEGSGGNQWVQDMQVNAGETYLILVDRSMGSGSFLLTFGGTAGLSCLTTGMHNNAENEKITLSPNPFSESALISIAGDAPASVKVLTVFDLSGKKLLETSFTGNTFRLNAPGLAEGMYIYTVSSSGEITCRNKFVIKK